VVTSTVHFTVVEHWVILPVSNIKRYIVAQWVSEK
jgi:hypothetical protein